MADPILPLPQSQVVLDQLVEWLGEISEDAGYYTSFGADVRTEQTRDAPSWDDPGADPLAPCLLVLDEDASYASPSLGQRGKWTQTFTVEALVADDGAGRALARRVLADIRRALHRRPTDWPAAAGVLAMRELSRELPRRASNSDWLTPSVTLDIDYVDKEA